MSEVSVDEASGVREAWEDEVNALKAKVEEQAAALLAAYESGAKRGNVVEEGEEGRVAEGRRSEGREDGMSGLLAKFMVTA